MCSSLMDVSNAKERRQAHSGERSRVVARAVWSGRNISSECSDPDVSVREGDTKDASMKSNLSDSVAAVGGAIASKSAATRSSTPEPICESQPQKSESQYI